MVTYPLRGATYDVTTGNFSAPPAPDGTVPYRVQGDGNDIKVEFVVADSSPGAGVDEGSVGVLRRPHDAPRAALPLHGEHLVSDLESGCRVEAEVSVEKASVTRPTKPLFSRCTAGKTESRALTRCPSGRGWELSMPR